MERHVYDPNQPQGIMSLDNLRNTIRALYQGDLMPLRPRASKALDDMEFSTDAAAAALWVGTGVTVTKSTTKQEGNSALQCVIDGTGNRMVSRLLVVDLSVFAQLTVWERCSAAGSTIKFYLKDSGDNESYWDITTDATPGTWKKDTFTLASPDSNNGTAADLSDIVEIGFMELDASVTYLFDTITAVCGLNVAVEPALVAAFYQQLYLGQDRCTFAGGGSPVITPPVANPRIDLLVISKVISTWTLEWVTGAEASSPAEPDFPTNKIPICLVYCRPTMTKVVDYELKAANPNEGYIYKDVRPLLVWMSIDAS